MMRTFIAVGLLVGTCATLVAAAPPDAGTAMISVAHMQDLNNEGLGEVVLRQTSHGLILSLALHDLPPGVHAFHIHATGTCLPPFKSAGGHFAPRGNQHGFANPKGPHAGDLPNLHVGEDRRVEVELFLPELRLDPGPGMNLLDADGAAFVIHAGADDYETDPAGDAGERIACGVIEAPRRQPVGTKPAAAGG